MAEEGELLTQSDCFLAGTLEHLLPLASDSDGDLTQYLSIHCCSVTKSWLTPCDLMHWSTLGYPVLHYLPELAQTHVHWVSDAIQPKHLLLPQSPPALNLPALGSFPMSWLFTSSGQSIGASASSPVIPIHNQGWFPLGLTCLISLWSKGLSRVFSSTTIQKHQFFGTQPSSWSNSHIHTWLLEKALTIWTFVYKVMSLCISIYLSHWIYILQLSSIQSLSRAWLFATPWMAAHQASLSITNSWSSPKFMCIESVMPQPSHPLSSPSPPAPNPSKHQGLFQWANSLHEVAKVLEFQPQHQSFQWISRTGLLWIFRTDFL